MKNNKTYLILVIGVFGIYNGNAFLHDQTAHLTYDANTNDTLRSEITPSQKLLVKEFRDENIKLLTDPYLRLDSPIIGFLRAKKWNKVAASKYLRKVLQWRAANNIEKLGEEAIDSNLMKFFPWDVKGLTKLGCPVAQAEYGEWRFDDYMSSQGNVHDANKSLRRHYLLGLETVRISIKKLIPRCEQALGLIDLKNFTMKNIENFNSFNSVIQLVVNIETYYLNFYKELIFFNSSEEFKNFFNSVKQYLPQTAKVMTFYIEAEYELARNHILSLIDPDQLSARYFGNKDL